MQAEIPTLLLHPDPRLLDRLLELASSIKCPKEQLNIRNYFVQHYIHCSKSKLDKKRDKHSELISIGHNTRKKKIEKQRSVVAEQIFLCQLIDGNLSWKDVAQKIGFKASALKRIEWNYSYYLIFALLGKMKGTLGSFFGVRLMNRTWNITQTIFQTLAKSSFLQNKINELMNRDSSSLKKIQFAFLRDIIFAIKFDENTEESLKRINFANYVDLKKEEMMDVAFYSEEWISFLCKKIKNNSKQQRPSIKYEKKQFYLKWSKAKVGARSQKDYFQQKLSHILKSQTNLQQEFINEIEIILLQAIIQKSDWTEVKLKVEEFTFSMNRVEEQSKNALSFSNSRSKSINSQLETSHKSQKMENSHQSPKLTQIPKSVRIEQNKTAQKCQKVEDAQQQSQGMSQKRQYSEQAEVPKLKRQKSLDLDQKRRHQRRSFCSSEMSKEASVFFVKDQAVQVNFQQPIHPKPKKPSQLKIDSDEEVVLSCCLKVMKLVSELKKSTIKGATEEQIDAYCQQNIQNIEGKYVHMLQFYERHKQYLATLENKNMKTLLYILLVAKNTQNFKDSFEVERKRKPNRDNTGGLYDYVKKEFDKIEVQLHAKIHTIRTQKSRQKS